MNPELVIEWLCRYFCVPKQRLMSRQRTDRLVWVRWIAFKLMSDFLLMSSNEIGAFFSKNHGTVLHGLKAVSKSYGYRQKELAKCVERFVKSELVRKRIGSVNNFVNKS